MKTTEHLIASMQEEFLARALGDFRDEFSRWMNGCESQIEIALGMALMLERFEGIGLFTGNVQPASSLIRGAHELGVEYVGGLYRQTKIGPYRADFYLEALDRETAERWCRIIIECDGHDFHEKTKFQAAHDKKRDRWFQTEGIAVLRFAGSEIWADPLSCASQVEAAFYAIYRRHYRPERPAATGK